MTRNTTSYREKGRAVVLAALMVLSVVAMSAAFVGSTAAQTDSSIDDNENFWEGEEVEFSEINSNTLQGSVVDVSEVDGDRGTELTISDGTATLDTTSQFLGPGEYTVSDGNSSATIEIRGQEIYTDAPDSVNQGDSIDVGVESDRSTYDAVVSSEQLSDSDLADYIAGADENDIAADGGVVLSGVSNDFEFTMDFDDEIATGEYNITVAATDTVAEDTFTLEVKDSDAASVSFGENLVRSTPGDHGVVQVDLEGTDTGTLNVTWENNGEVYHILTGDVTGDEVGSDVSIELNTHYLVNENSLGTDSDVIGDVENGEFEVTDGGEELGAGVWSYTDQLDMALYSDSTETDRQDRGTFRLTDRSTDDISVYATSTDGEDWENYTVEGDEVAMQDYAVLEVEADGIFGYFDDFENNNVSLDVTHTNPGFQGTELELNTSNIVAEEENSRFLVFMEMTDEGVDNGDLVANAHFEATFTVGEDNIYTDEEESVSTEFTVVDREFGFDADSYNVDAAEGVQISGTTNVAPGHMVEVTADGHADNPFWKDATAETQADGTWSAEFDFSGEPEGATFDLTATERTSGDSDTAAGTVGDAPKGADFRVSTTVPDQVEVDGDASLDVTVTNAGKQAGEETLTVTIDGEEYTEDVSLDADSAEDFSWDIDTSSEGDIDWSASVGDASDSGTLTVGDTGSDGDDGDDGDDDGSDGDDDGEDGDDGEDSPGFGVAVALVALLSAAMLALRRQN